jgi:hypothetical protein
MRIGTWRVKKSKIIMWPLENAVVESHVHNVFDISHVRRATYEAEDLKTGTGNVYFASKSADQLSSSRTNFLRQMEYSSDALLATAIAAAIGPISICSLHVLEAKA